MKKNLFKLLLGAATVAGGAITLTSCGNDAYTDQLYGATITAVDASDVKFVKKGKLTVGMSTDFAPSEFMDTTKKGNAQFAGSDVSFAQALAKAFNVELEIKAMEFSLILPAIDNNTLDIAISGYSYTPTRAAAYLPTDCYWDEGDDGQVIIVKQSDISKYQTLESLNNSTIKIGVQTASLQDMLVTEQIPNATRVQIANLDDAITTLEAGALDAIAFAGGQADVKAQLNSGIAIVPEKLDDTGYTGNFAWVKKDNVALKNAVNQVIAEIKENDYYQLWHDAAEALVLQLGDKAQEIIPE